MSDWVKLLKENFASYIINNEFRYKNLSWSLNENNREKIFCALTTGKLNNLCRNNDSGVYKLEYPVTKISSSKPADVVIIHQKDDMEFVVGIIENKIVNHEERLDIVIEDALCQVYDNYFSILKTNGCLLNKANVDNIFISINCYNPDKFLSRSDNFQNYLSSDSKDYRYRFSEFGMIHLSLSFDNLSIKNKSQFVDLFFSGLKSATLGNSKIAFVNPSYLKFKGDVFCKKADPHEVDVRVHFDGLKNLPFFNPNPVSNISNTRNYEDDKKEKLENEIFETMATLHKQTQVSSNPTSEGEAHRSLGAKSRILSYNINQTIVDFQVSGEKIINVVFVTTDMALVDGQHSSKAFIDILNTVSKEVLDQDGQKIIKSVYKNNKGQNFDFDSFKRFCQNQTIDLSIRGFENTQNAQLAAKNQNSIRKQSKKEEVINQSRELITKLAEYWNKKSDSVKLIYNKSSYLMLENEVMEFNLKTPEILTPIWGLWSSEKKYINNLDINGFISKTGSSANYAMGNNFQNSIEWFFVDNKNLTRARFLLEKLKEEIERSDEDLCNSVEIDKITQELLKLVCDEKVARRVISISVDIEDENYDLACEKANDLLGRYIKSSSINTERLDAALMINEIALSDESIIKIPFFARSSSDQIYYFLNIFNLYIKIYAENNDIKELGRIKRSDLIDLKALLVDKLEALKTDNNVLNKNQKSLHFGLNGGAMDQYLFDFLFKDILSLKSGKSAKNEQ